ncbi:cupin domain-containing protein [Bacillus cereus]|nr:cupin domain-containing protein [Bacillus cereus]
MPWFFAYGISTNPEQMVKDIGGYKNYKKAVLENYIYTFTGYHEDFRGGTSTIIPQQGGGVYGVAYQIETEQIDDLIKNGHGYILKENIAKIDNGSMPVYTLQLENHAPLAIPSKEYLEIVKNGLLKNYKEDFVDLYLGRALKRVQNEGLIDYQPVSKDSFTNEYNSQFRRLFPWHVTKQQPFGSAWAIVEPGEQTNPHHHDEEETFIVLSGKGIINVDGQEKIVGKGDIIYFEPFSTHTIKNIGDTSLEFLCIWWGALLEAR